MHSARFLHPLVLFGGLFCVSGVASRGSEKPGPLSTHVLDTSTGRPAAGIVVSLDHRRPDQSWSTIAKKTTDADGRINDFLPDDSKVNNGVYRLTFDTGPYFQDRGVETFYPEIPVIFRIDQPAEHFHVPLLVSPFGYSTYRGS